MAGPFLYLKYIRTSFLLLLRVGPGSYQLRLIYLVSHASGCLLFDDTSIAYVLLVGSGPPVEEGMGKIESLSNAILSYLSV